MHDFKKGAVSKIRGSKLIRALFVNIVLSVAYFSSKFPAENTLHSQCQNSKQDNKITGEPDITFIENTQNKAWSKWHCITSFADCVSSYGVGV